MLVGSVVSILAFYNAFGEYAQAFSPFIALTLAFVLSPVLAIATKGKYYIARDDMMTDPLWVDGQLSAVAHECTVCTTSFERPDMASCPFHSGPICSLCCSLDKACHDMCKKGNGLLDLTVPSARVPG
jgi:hypothetical protein